jgi:iron complex transport system ATP-binding protein
MSAMLQCRSVSVQVGGKALLVDATLRLRPGCFTAVLGPNGAGKSTLLSVLSGQRVPSVGEVSLDGHPLHSLRASQLALRRAVMPQESAVAFDFTAREVVALGRFPHRLAPRADEDALIDEAMALTDVLPLGTRVLNTLSGGEKARVHLARVLLQLWHPRADGAARWLLLDEPTAALDLAHQHAAMRLLRARAAEGFGVVAVLHDLNLALRYADEVVVVRARHAATQGATQALLQSPLIEAVWQARCQEVVGEDGVRQFLFR